MSAVVAAATAGCGSKGSFTVAGTLSINAPGFTYAHAGDGAPCFGSSGYDDIDQGTRLTVEGPSGKKIATGELGKGKVTDNGTFCEFTFKIPDVPRGDDDSAYTVALANRGSLDFREPEAKRLRLRLG